VRADVLADERFKIRPAARPTIATITERAQGRPC
jgi:hypothetical protein